MSRRPYRSPQERGDEEDVARFFADVRKVTAAGSRVAFSSLDADEKGGPRIGVMDAPIRFALKLAGEARSLQAWSLQGGSSNFG